jgi:hypothetical protein
MNHNFGRASGREASQQITPKRVAAISNDAGTFSLSITELTD